jgi:hypothetical protein
VGLAETKNFSEGYDAIFGKKKEAAPRAAKAKPAAKPKPAKPPAKKKPAAKGNKKKK